MQVRSSTVHADEPNAPRPSRQRTVQLEDIMNKFANRAMFGLATLFGLIWLAPTSYAMVAPEPVPATSTSTLDVSTGGLAIWQVIGIALVAVAIGALGATIAQRTRRHDVHSLTTA
jgi:hypothetical protein